MTKRFTLLFTSHFRVGAGAIITVGMALVVSWPSYKDGSWTKLMNSMVLTSGRGTGVGSR